ncbi:MAG: hypothetical protein OWQ54_06355 [Sulfolobaceae archaeon]|nr:hypothetical protein [Sulfolobaceae archaeon]
MKVLLISILKEPKNLQKEIHPLDVVSSQPSSVKSLSNYTFVAQHESLVSEGHETKTILLAPASLSYLIEDNINSFKELEEKLTTTLRSSIPENIQIFITPGVGSEYSKNGIEHKHIGGPGNILYFAFYYIRNVINDFKPDTVLLDISNSDNILSTLALDATQTAIIDYLTQNEENNKVSIIVTSLINEEMRVLNKQTLEAGQLDLHNYFIREFKLMNPLRQDVKQLSAVGKTELNRIGILLDLGLIIPLLYELSNFYPSKMYSPEDFIDLVYKNIKIERKEEEKRIIFDYGLELLEGVPYYIVGRDFLIKYRKGEGEEKGKYSIDDIKRLLRFLHKGTRYVIEGKLTEIKQLINLLSTHGITEGRTTLYNLRSIGNMSTIEFHRPNAIRRITYLLKSRQECDDIDAEQFLSNLGFLENILEIEFEKDSIKLGYIQDCIDNIFNIIKEFLPS